MRKFLRYSSAASATGLFVASAAAQLSRKNWDLRDREMVIVLATAGVLTALTWTATLA